MSQKIIRTQFLGKIRQVLKQAPIACILGPRQCGKTTLAREFIKDCKDVTYFDLSDAADLKTLQSPKTVLTPLTGLIVLDEVQKQPEVFPALRVLADREDQPAQFLILGSASPEIQQASSESLAGRIAFIDMGGFGLDEIDDSWEKLWLRGSFPKSYLAINDEESFVWRENFVRTFIERDIATLGLPELDSHLLKRFFAMLAHYHGKEFNAAEMSKSLSINVATIKKYLNVLTHAFLIYQLPPWHENLKKRQVKSVKIYFRDTGLLHFFHDIETRMQLLRHPCLGFSFEGFVLEQIIRHAGLRYTYFWKVHAGSELDIFVNKRGRRTGFEVKFSDAPSMTQSMRISRDNLNLDKLYVVYPGIRAYPLEDKIETLPIGELVSKSRTL